jgi:enoyl-CoA hydratase
MTESLVLVDRDPPIATVRLNRPEVLNALSHELIAALISELRALDADDDVQAIVLTGNDRAFAAGADVSAMAENTVVDHLREDAFARWAEIRAIRKPIVAAVSGWALGGGNEIAMACDMIVASETARFGQPEIDLGIIPGAGGTQRLAQAVGKARAMELVLTGRRLTAQEALGAGLVNKVAPVEEYLSQAQELARTIAAKPPLAVQAAKRAVNNVFDDYLDRGLSVERQLFYALFATADQKEGMRAFSEKRKPAWQGR